MSDSRSHPRPNSCSLCHAGNSRGEEPIISRRRRSNTCHKPADSLHSPTARLTHFCPVRLSPRQSSSLRLPAAGSPTTLSTKSVIAASQGHHRGCHCLRHAVMDSDKSCLYRALTCIVWRVQQCPPLKCNVEIAPFVFLPRGSQTFLRASRDPMEISG